jgi:hypothetical protein
LTEIRDNAKVQQSLSNGLKTRDKPQTLFSDQEQRQRDRIYIAGQIASNAFGVCFGSVKGNGLEDHYYPTINDGIIAITDDLLNKLYSK